MSKLSENVVLFSQGAYGCIFMEDVTVQGKKENPKFIKKVQKRKETSDNEKNIGKEVKKIQNYTSYFAPIEESSQVELSSTDSNEIKKCEFITDEKKEFETNKIRFVGEHSLANYLNLLSKREKNANTFLETFLDTYSHLCEGVSKLSKKKILHMDLKENNIVFDEKRKVPIIIDFGLSREVEKDNAKDIFFVYGPDYSPWCFDISFLTYICNELGEDWESKIIDEAIMSQTINDFLSSNEGVKALLNENQRGILKQNLENEMKKYVNYEGKKVYEMLIKKSNSWDNYSLAIIFLYILRLMSNEIIEGNELIKALKKVLINIIVDNENRQTADETIKELYKEFSSKSKESAKLLVDEFKKEFTPERYNARTLMLLETKQKTERKNN